MLKDMLELTHGASNNGGVVKLKRVKHCGIIWSSDPNIIAAEKNGGWTRGGTCGKCDVDLTPFDDK
jgi:hypothetical protein